uniref:Thiamine biosynthesis protein n=1 Tax=Bulboplastis apyrenoidosa TaxID=1070855 RepID=A0A1Y9TMF1_9RHOD|nr:thiamine biosynthesis protein [Bulboplastis apyrenoidosa]ARO90840.1 thiamine biosynthesis protein [Bulboplastis apyrenoidosa]
MQVLRTIDTNITIEVNGEPFLCTIRFYKWALNDLIEYLNFDKNLILIEYNNKVIDTLSLKNILLQDQDKIEIITLVGGGI